MSDFVRQQNSVCDFGSSDSWVILSPIEQSIKRKIEKVGTPLKDWDIQINYGIKTGFNEAFIISTEKRKEILANCQTEEERKKTAELIRPILRGRDIKRYGYVDNGLFLINTHNGIRNKLPRIDINDYPAVKVHLDQYWDRISARADKGDTPYNLRNCAYLEDFSKPKIVYMEIQTDNEKEGYPFPCFSYDNSNKIVLNTAYIISSNTEDVRFILGVINSKMGRFLTKLYVSQLQERQFRMLAQYVKNFPIPKLPQNEIDYIIKAVEYNINKYNSELEKEKNRNDVYDFEKKNSTLNKISSVEFKARSIMKSTNFKQLLILGYSKVWLFEKNNDSVSGVKEIFSSTGKNRLSNDLRLSKTNPLKGIEKSGDILYLGNIPILTYDDSVSSVFIIDSHDNFKSLMDKINKEEVGLVEE